MATMKSLTEHLWFEVPGRRDFVNITSTVEALVRQSVVREGLCLVNASISNRDVLDDPIHDVALALSEGSGRKSPHKP